MGLNKKISFAIVTVAILLVSGCGNGSAKVVKVYLLAGQSNMAGRADSNNLPAELQMPQENVLIYHSENPTVTSRWEKLQPGFSSVPGDGVMFGPEISFASEMAKANHGDKIAIIKYAFGGTDLYSQWRAPDENGQNARTLYQQFVPFVENALESLEQEYKIEAMLWQQGEKDSRDDSKHKAVVYQQRLTNFIESLRDDFDKPDMLFLVGQVSELEKKDLSPRHNYPYCPVVRQAQVDVSNKLSNVKLVETRGITFTEDSVHYDAAGMVELGRRFAKAAMRTAK